MGEGVDEGCLGLKSGWSMGERGGGGVKKKRGRMEGG